MTGKVIWMESNLGDYGIDMFAFLEKEPGKPPFVEIVGYNGFLKGEEVYFRNKKYVIVSVFTNGEFGLSETETDSYSVRSHPNELRKS